MSSENPYAGQGSVLLDIGEDTGALVVTMPRAMVGTEVEIRPLDQAPGHSPGPGQVHDHAHGLAHGHAHDHGHDHAHGPGHLAHVEVVERPVADGTVPSLVFGELTAGRYDLFEKGHPAAVVLTVDVDGGRVTSADWPD